MTQIPRGSKDLVCPLHSKTMERVCHMCPLWVQVRGKDANSGKEIDQWNCSLAWLPTLLIENAKQTRSAAAATESFRNEMVRYPALEFARQMAIMRGDAGSQKIEPPRLQEVEQPKLVSVASD